MNGLYITLAIIGGIIVITGLWQLGVWIGEVQEKNRTYKKALEFARKTGKPLLVGGPWGVQPWRRRLNIPAHGEGDICLDIDRRAVEGHRCPIVASITDIPFADKSFGAVFFSHVMEHLPTTAMAKKATEELNRVAEGVFIVYPSRQSFAAWIIPVHYLWVWRKGNNLYFQQRRIHGNKETIVVETTNNLR